MRNGAQRLRDRNRLAATNPGDVVVTLSRYSEIQTQSARAQQIYAILCGLAYNRQSITYGGLAEVVGFAGAGVFAGMLGEIMHWCAENRLPPLTVLVVNGTTGLPGEGLTTPEDVHAEREMVFNYDWYDLVAPTAAELDAANDRAREAV